MQNNSLGHIYPSNLKNFLRKICIVGFGHEKRPSVTKKSKLSLKDNKENISDTETEKKLRTRVHELEEELIETRKERDNALEENRNKINELNNALMSVKSTLKEVLQLKRERIRHLERKIMKTVK